MPLFNLIPHPDHLPHAIGGVTAHLKGSVCDPLWVYYDVRDAASLVTPPRANPARANNLWQTTCFELFLKSPDRDAYNEFNFSPSGQWAAYAFDTYRAGMRELPTKPPHLDVGPAGRKRFYLGADLHSAALCDDLQIALAAVLQEEDGTKSYWALAHAPGPPDFHNPACFIATLPAPKSP